MTTPVRASAIPKPPNPPTQALLAALHAVHPNFLTAGMSLSKAVDKVFHKVAASAFRQSRYRNEGEYCRVASEFTAAVIRATRWTDELAAIPPNPNSCEPAPEVHQALVAALAQRIVVDGVSVATQVKVTCRRAVQKVLDAAGAQARAS